MLKRFAALLFIVVWLGGAVLWSQWHTSRSKEKNAQFAKDVADPGVPPVLSEAQSDPSWTIRKWLSVDKGNSDCETANEMMDRGASEKVLTKRGAVIRTYTLADYVHSCETFGEKMLTDIVDPQARKWCMYRGADSRFDELCREWEQNRSQYLDEMNARSKPISDRYRQFVGQ